MTDHECEDPLQKLDANPEYLSPENEQLAGFFSLVSDHSMLEYVCLLTEIRDQPDSP